MSRGPSFYQPPGRYLSVAQGIQAPTAAVWTLLIDTHTWPRWGPSVAAVRCSDRFIQYASAGSIKTRLGFWLPFIITDFDEGACWAWKVAGIRATGHRVAALNDKSCCLIFDIPRIAAPYAWICRTAARRIKQMAEPIEVPHINTR